MAKYYPLLLLLPIATLGNSQDLKFISSEADVQVQIYKKQLQDRIITVTDDKIKVTNFFDNADKKDLNADIQYSENKEYLGLGMSKWHYCKVSGDKDGRTYALIVPEELEGKWIVLQEVINNVVSSNTDFYVD